MNLFFWEITNQLNPWDFYFILVCFEVKQKIYFCFFLIDLIWFLWTSQKICSAIKFNLPLKSCLVYSVYDSQHILCIFELRCVNLEIFRKFLLNIFSLNLLFFFIKLTNQLGKRKIWKLGKMVRLLGMPFNLIHIKMSKTW